MVGPALIGPSCWRCRRRLFRPFEQLGGQRTRHSDGRGLGLAIVRAHGATLTPRARPEGGLNIEVTFAAAERFPLLG
jgi:signal transduction histidine kinase